MIVSTSRMANRMIDMAEAKPYRFSYQKDWKV